MTVGNVPVLLALAATVVMVVVAGCLGQGTAPPRPDTTPPSIPADAADATVHGPAGVRLEPVEYPGDLPVMKQRYVERGAGYEPTVAVNRRGTAFYPVYSEVLDGSAPTSLSQVRIVRTHDDGVSWYDVTPKMLGRDAVPLAFDPIVHADPGTDRVFFAYTYAGCMEVLWTDDEGESWDRNPAACASVINDHETVFSGPPPGDAGEAYPSIVYICSNQMVVPTAQCAISDDGGETWVPASPIPAPFTTYGTGPGCQTPGNIHGHGEASQADGTAYVPFTYCGTVYAAISRDGGRTWERVVVDDTAGALHHEAAVGVDAAGNAYVAWIGADFRPRLSVSTDQGHGWSDPIDIGSPGLTMASPHYMGVAAGHAGRVAIHYLATDADTAAGTPADVDPKTAWHSYVAFLPDALRSKPVIATTTSDPPGDPVHRGPCDGPGYRCRGMADYVGLTTHPVTGQVWASFVDVCTLDCPDGDGSSRTRNRASVGVQIAGMTLGPRVGSDGGDSTVLRLDGDPGIMHVGPASGQGP